MHIEARMTASYRSDIGDTSFHLSIEAESFWFSVSSSGGRIRYDRFTELYSPPTAFPGGRGAWLHGGQAHYLTRR